MRRRKIVFLMTDTQRWDMVNCYRQTGLSTPCIDALAARGTRFTRAYTTQPVCQAARAAIFMGQYPHSVGSWTNSVGPSISARHIGQRLELEGVRTAYIGKWHLDGGDYFGLGICPEGWDPDSWYDMRNYLEELTPQERLDSRRPGYMLERDVPASFTYGYRCADRAIDFLKKHGGEDFFLAVSFDEPHGPSLCPPPYSAMYADYDFPVSENVFDDMRGKPEHQRIWGAGNRGIPRGERRIREPFLFGCNSFVDEQIGRVIEAVDRLVPDAIIIYTSDHGDMLFSHGLTAKGPCTYDEITRIPLILSGKGIPEGRVDDRPVSHVDLMPTILEWMAAPLPDVLEGRSLLAQIERDVRVNPYIFMEFGRYEVDHDGFGGFQPLRCAFDGRYKLTVNLLTSDELYDLDTDPGELHNLIDSKAHAQVRDALHDAMLEFMNRTRDPFRGYYWERRPWRRDAREASWEYTLMTRQRVEDPRFESRQLDYNTGLPIAQATRVKG